MKLLTFDDERRISEAECLNLFYTNNYTNLKYSLVKQLIYQEYFFDDLLHFKPPVYRWKILTENREGKLREMLGDMSHPFLQNESLLEFMFPPSIIYTDSIQERSLAYRASQFASGKILVLGLRMAIFPQFCQILKRDFSKILIVEQDKLLIELIGEAWQRDENIEIIHEDINCFLTKNKEKFDFIYLHNYTNFNYNLVPYINFLLQKISIFSDGDTYVCPAAYSFMIEDFVGLCQQLEKNNSLEKINLENQELLLSYVSWRKKQEKPMPGQIAQKSRQIITESISEYMPELPKDNFLEKYF